MKFSLRKGHSHIHIGYKDEDYSNNISGDNFEIEYDSTINRIHINLESNLIQRNKQCNSYYDTQEFIRKSDSLKLVQIDEEQVIKGLAKAHQKHPDNSWELKLHAGINNSFNYSVKPSSNMGSVFLDVIDV